MRKNGKLGSLKTPHKILNILEKLERRKDSKYLFKELDGVGINDKKHLRIRIKRLLETLI